MHREVGPATFLRVSFAPMRMPRPGAADAVLYALGAAVAGGVGLFAAIPLQREWGRLAVGPYAAGAVAAFVLHRLGAGVRARTWLAAAVVVGVVVMPLALEATWRARSHPGLHAQSEVIITEEAARALLQGRDPYATTYVHGPLAARPLGTTTHFPYLPLMMAFGMPRAAGLPAPLSDARLWFAVGTSGVGGLMLRRWPGEAERKLRVAQALVLLPTSALLLPTGGDDMPVVALLGLAVAFLAARKPRAAGVVAGLAAAMKQTAWPVLPFLLLAARNRDGSRARAAFAGPVAVIVVAVMAPFVLWHPAAFVEDAVKFPLGLGRQPSAAGTPTIGTALLRLGPHGPLTVALVAIIALVAVVLLVRTRTGSTRDAARAAGLAWLVALLLAPAARIGYLVYPLNLLAWGWLLREPATVEAPQGGAT